MRTLVSFILILTILMFTAFYFIGSSETEMNTSIEIPGATTTTTKSLPTTTTTISGQTTTTTTFTASTSGPIANLSSDKVANETISWLERRTFELVNSERIKRGLAELKWNEEVAAVARLHSKDMAEHGFFSHTGSDGSNATERLKAAGIYYWNLSGENILMESGVDYYSVNLLGQIKNVWYETFEELAQEASKGWMNSTGHRENILTSEFDESAMGVYVLQKKMGDSSYANVSYYFTQDFITRIQCGYVNSSCCVTTGYLPWCYVPWKCTGGVCA